ncbi:hypothetical protein DR950_17675 [Kitasatospora xanthocidica]|uniref:Uncharacterized protein n=1 Tax=Kitasatospora xanthocidica TaxID=83382 RepID=A0A372ZU15_9ACTN|nr:hypothetical protein [Kitasatospora xanthocidica]RGD59373.1 hypothetical protein DR950_17675 [Kitasatospora xanthocidica]
MTDHSSQTSGRDHGHHPSRPAPPAGTDKDDDRTPPALDPAVRLYLKDMAAMAVARCSMWRLALLSGNEDRIAAARAAAEPAIRRLADVQLHAGLITTEQHAQRLKALEYDDTATGGTTR